MQQDGHIAEKAEKGFVCHFRSFILHYRCKEDEFQPVVVECLSSFLLSLVSVLILFCFSNSFHQTLDAVQLRTVSH